MAIRKLPSGKFKSLLRGTDGHWLPLGSFNTKQEAEAASLKAQTEKESGRAVTAELIRLTLNDYFIEWADGGTSKASNGWKLDQIRMYEQYVSPLIGKKRLDQLRSAEIAEVLKAVAKQGKSVQMQLHVYNLLHKLLGDAVEMFEYLRTNPVKRSLRPEVPEKETAHLKVEEAVRLLQHVRGKPYELAIWLNLYVGLRVGEIQALTWQNVDFEDEEIRVRATYVRKERRIQDHPKGKKWHDVTMPPELLKMLQVESIGKKKGDFVVSSARQEMLGYGGYLRALKSYCKEAGLPEIATHGLRHSTSGIYMANGATRDDLYQLFKHSSSDVTARYIHSKGEHIQQVAKLIRLFPEQNDCNNGKRISNQ
ncbi:site-specific integrase [Bdellovibrionota bacterium FG-1]